MSVILGKHPSSVYCELRWNSTGGVCSGQETHGASEQRRVDTKPCPKIDHPVLTGEIMRLFPQDLSPEQISGRLGVHTPKRRKSRLHHRLSTPSSTGKRHKTRRLKYISDKTTPSEGDKRPPGPDSSQCFYRRTPEKC
jgi:IS30 family transposase